ncbi:MAG: ribonuclease HI [Burkholderiaceae bacterium]|nr:ribonuclease HI [Burkholderiaceae bacterium]
MRSTVKKLQVTLTFLAADKVAGKHIVSSMLGSLAVDGIKATAGPVVEAADQSVITVYTDGGCDLRKDGIGAWAYLAEFPDGHVVEQCEPMLGTTNNRMELMAVIKALESLEFGPPVKVFSDSEYVIKGVTQWSRNWVRNGWRTREGKPVINKDLWEPLLQLYQLHAVTFEHVKGHSGHPQNERVDKLCTAAMTNAHKNFLAGTDIDEACHKDYA